MVLSRFCGWLEAAPQSVQEAHRSQTTPAGEGVPVPETALCAWQFLLEQKLVTHHISPCLQLVSRRQKVPEAMVEEVGDGQGAAQAGKGEHQLNPHRMSPEFVHGRLHLSMVAVRLLGRRAPVQHDGAPGTPCTVCVSGVSRRETR